MRKRAFEGPRSSVDVYTVHSTIQLEERVLPFFEENALRVKRYDFEQFAFSCEGDSSQRSPPP